MGKIKDLIDPQLVNDIVDEILSDIREKREDKKFVQTSIPHSELTSVRARLEALEKAWEIGETEDVRNVTEKFETLKEDLEAQVARLDGQLGDLRTAMIRLSGELRKLREEKSFS